MLLARTARVSVTAVAVTVVAVAMALLPSSPAHAAFPDTRDTHFNDAVRALVAEGAIEGCRDGSRFCPGDSITRAQMASMITRTLGLPAADGDRFRDTAGSVHEANIDALAQAGITVGCNESGTRFCPQDSITRAEMGTMLARALETTSTSQRWFDDIGGTHAPAIDEIAASGITAGCARPDSTYYCPQEDVQRQQAALFLARGHDLVAREQVASLEERRAETQQAQTQSSRDQMWEDLAQCESGGNWSINTGNGYYGGLQFSLSSWQWVGGSGYPHQSSRAEQIHRAEILLERQGWGAWPSCSRQLGYR